MKGPGVELDVVSNEPELLVMDAHYEGTGQLPPAEFRLA